MKRSYAKHTQTQRSKRLDPEGGHQLRRLRVHCESQRDTATRGDANACQRSVNHQKYQIVHVLLEIEPLRHSTARPSCGAWTKVAQINKWVQEDGRRVNYDGERIE